MFRKLILFLLLVSFTGLGLLGQDRKIFKENFLEGEYFFLRGDFEEAIFYYRECLKMQPTNHHIKFLIGASYLSIYGQKDRAIPFLEDAVEGMSSAYREGNYREDRAPREALFALARAYHINQEFDKAIEYYRLYQDVMLMKDVSEIDYVKKQIKACELAREFTGDPLDVHFVNLGKNVNHSPDNYHPVFSPADSTLVYMSRRPFYNPIMMTRMVGGGWMEPEVINDQVKADGDVYVTGISRDGKQLILAWRKDLDYDLYISRKEDGRWQAAQPIKGSVNSGFDEFHACLSADGKRLYFSSNRGGGYGASDLYYSDLGTDGTWRKPVNLGRGINTLYSEDAPFITSDGKKLFFSSQGHATMGGYDIFFVSLLPDGRWSAPSNIGYPVNTPDNDLFFYPLDRGDYGLYATIRDSLDSKRSIYALNLFSGEKEELVTLRGSVKFQDNLNAEINPTRVHVMDERTRDTLAVLDPEPITGEFSLELPEGSYLVTTESSGYVADSQSITAEPGRLQAGIFIEPDLKPEKVARGEYALIRNLLFDFDSYGLNHEAKIEAERLFRIMEANPGVMVQVTGHTDAVGSEEYNLELSRKRARSVVDYLVDLGISRDHFVTVGKGETESLALNTSAEGRKLNRNVEVKLINPQGKELDVNQLFVPEELKPVREEAYYVLLTNDYEQRPEVPQNIEGFDIHMIETDITNFYTMGGTLNKIDAVKLVNEASDQGFPDARIISNQEMMDMVKRLTIYRSIPRGPFTIQLMALRKRLEREKFDEWKDVREYKGKDRLFRYTRGYYEDYESAKEALFEEIDADFYDAFVMPLSEYNAMAGEQGFTIQLVATLKPVGKEYFNKLENLWEEKSEDGFYRYLTGSFASRREAEIKLKEIRDIGYKDAFVKRYP